MSCPSCLYELIQQHTTLTCVTSTSFLSHLSLFSLCHISPVFPTHFPIHTHIPPPPPAEAPVYILYILSITHVRIHLQHRSPRIALHEQAWRLRRFTFTHFYVTETCDHFCGEPFHQPDKAHRSHRTSQQPCFKPMNPGRRTVLWPQGHVSHRHLVATPRNRNSSDHL